MFYRSLLLLTLILTLAGCAAPQADMTTPIIPTSTQAAYPVAVATMVPQGTATLPPDVAGPGPTPTMPEGVVADTGSTPTLPPTPAPTSSNIFAEAGALEGPVKTYTNATARFSMDFPANWEIIDISQQINATRMYTVSANSPLQPRGPKQQEGLLPGESKMDINVNPSEQPMTYGQALDYWRASITGGEFPARITDERSGTLPSGLPATRWVVDNGQHGVPVVWTLVEVNGNIINFIGMGDPATIDKITATVRPAQE